MLNTEQVKSSTTPIRVAKKNGNQERDGIAQSQLRRRLSRSFLSGQYLSLLVGRRYNRPLGLFSISPMVALERPIHSTCRLRTIGPDSQRVQSVCRSSPIDHRNWVPPNISEDKGILIRDCPLPPKAQFSLSVLLGLCGPAGS